MVLHVIEALAINYFPSKYVVHIVAIGLAVLVLRAFSQGRRTNRERDLHARTILLTGGFSPLGLTLLQSLAQRGAHIIALSSEPIDSPSVSILVDLLRSTTSNEQIYAEECDLSSPSSIRTFCTKFLTGQDQRLDAIIFVHEHKHIGTPRWFTRTSNIGHEQKERDANSLATFLITTLLLPALLVAPAERDIRIINVVNPFYAAAAGLSLSPWFSSTQPTDSTPPANSIFLLEGLRSLRTITFTRHLQRVLDALPTGAQAPKVEEGFSAVPVVSSKIQKSNIVAITASPGISRVDTMASILNADYMSPTGSLWGLFLYIIFQPLLRILTKSPISSIQSILHVLFLPTPFKILAGTTSITNPTAASNKTPDPQTKTSSDTPPQGGGPIDMSVLEMPEEVLLPGALYSDCAAVKLKVQVPEEMKERDREVQVENEKAKEKEQSKKNKARANDLKEEVFPLLDDGQYGGELAGRLVWEQYEVALKIWEKENPGPPEEQKKVPNSATPTSTKKDGFLSPDSAVNIGGNVKGLEAQKPASPYPEKELNPEDVY